MNTNLSSVSGVRHRVIRKALQKLDPSTLPKLGPGQMQLYSFYTPGLETGLYDIKAEQIINASGQEKTITATQSFLVTAPRFSIDTNLIHSTFPLPGVSAHPNILPHIVFKDPHLPWQTAVCETKDESIMRVPWLAVVAFEHSELALSAEDSIFAPGFQPGTLPKQSFTMSTSMTRDMLTQYGLNSAVPELGQSFSSDDATNFEVIFPKMDLFLSLFTDSASSPSIDLDRYKYLAHTRQVNTTHMSDAGVVDEGTFSVVVSHRTGPVFSAGSPVIPKPCVVHVISLDMVQQVPKSSLLRNKRAALVSLFSWSYDCLPPETINFEDIMREVGNNAKLFGTPQEIRNEAGADTPADIKERIQHRIDDGYTLLRYRVQTGEETVALMRGPLIPRPVPPHKVAWFNPDDHSNTGENLQIIDTTLKMIDISYCTAWQLGKLLAIADQAFCAAMLRIRAAVHTASDQQAKENILSAHFEAATAERVIKSLPDTFHKLAAVAADAPGPTRWSRPLLTQNRYNHLASEGGVNQKPDAQVELRSKIVRSLTGTADGSSHFTEHKEPASTDWSLVLNWLMDKIYLEGIPPHYLIPDPTWLPSESIRFFYVDSKWLSALVDGALSVSNHLDKNDITRQAIKNELRKYLKKDIHPKLKYPPQVPAYGFFMRSVAVAAFPDLVVRAPWPDPTDVRAELLRHENVRKDVMFCLLDRTPKDLQTLVISQPSHQQCFAFGHDGTLTDKSITVELRKVYSVQTDKSMDVFPEKAYTRGPDGRCDVYDWNSRTIRLDNYAGLILSTLQEARKTDPDIYSRDVICAALMGIQLNDPIYKLTFLGLNTTSPNDHGAAATVALPAMESSHTPSNDEHALPIKITEPVRPPGPKGPPRRTKSGPPSLFQDKSRGPLRAALVVPPKTPSPNAPTLLPLDSTFDDITSCSSRFTPLCFTRGYVPSPIPADGDKKPVIIFRDGTDVIFRLLRNTSELSSTDFISSVKVAIPLGTTPDCLICVAPGKDDAYMLNNVRLTILIRSYANGIVVELKPKQANRLTLLAHNIDLSFRINGVIFNNKSEDVTIPIIERYTSQEGNAKVAVNRIEHVEARDG